MSSDEESRFSGPALKRWREIPKGVQFRLINNVYCVKCARSTGMLGHRGRVEGGILTLRGSCSRCGGKVVRVIES